jgi:hypothetical protein
MPAAPSGYRARIDFPSQSIAFDGHALPLASGMQAVAEIRLVTVRSSSTCLLRAEGLARSGTRTMRPDDARRSTGCPRHSDYAP